jgi:hypothetical protein
VEGQLYGITACLTTSYNTEAAMIPFPQNFQFRNFSIPQNCHEFSTSPMPKPNGFDANVVGGQGLQRGIVSGSAHTQEGKLL